MFNLQNKKRNDYSEKDLAKLDETLNDYREWSRDLESHTVNDLEKHLWLANGAGATIAMGFIQARQTVPEWQYIGAWLFVLGILSLVLVKSISAVNSSRDRLRFQDARSRFDAEEVSDEVFRNIRDKTFLNLKRTYFVLQGCAGVAFILGLIFTLVGVGYRK